MKREWADDEGEEGSHDAKKMRVQWQRVDCDEAWSTTSTRDDDDEMSWPDIDDEDLFEVECAEECEDYEEECAEEWEDYEAPWEDYEEECAEAYDEVLDEDEMDDPDW